MEAAGRHAPQRSPMRGPRRRHLRHGAPVTHRTRVAARVTRSGLGGSTEELRGTAARSLQQLTPRPRRRRALRSSELTPANSNKVQYPDTQKTHAQTGPPAVNGKAQTDGKPTRARMSWKMHSASGRSTPPCRLCGFFFFNTFIRNLSPHYSAVCTYETAAALVTVRTAQATTPTAARLRTAPGHRQPRAILPRRGAVPSSRATNSDITS